MLPQQVLDELIRRENISGIYRTRIAAQILIDQLIVNNERRRAQ